MTRRSALAKATIVTGDAAAGLLDPEQARRFIRALKVNTGLTGAMRHETRTSPEGEINKISTGARIIRAASENADDGYRAGAAFDTVEYATRKIRLPWEVTEDVFQENIEQQELEDTLGSEMTQQFALDLEDLDVNGDTADIGADAAFLNINDGILKQIVTAAVPGMNIDLAAAPLSKGVLFDALYAMPTAALQQLSNRLRWLVSPRRKINWWELMANESDSISSAALVGNGEVLNNPLSIPFLEVPSLPDNTILLADPRNLVRVTSWQVRKRRVTGETDATLAARDKRFYVWFIKTDVIIEEVAHIARLHNIAAI